MRLASIELNLQDARAAADFLSFWGLEEAGVRGQTVYMRGSGADPYLVALSEAQGPSVRSLTFNASEAELAGVAERIEARGGPCRDVISDDLGGGAGLVVQMPEGETFRFLAGVAPVDRLERPDMPVQLTHVVMNSIDAEATATYAEQALGFRVSDRTRAMVFVRCNQKHHSVAFARAGLASLNHIAFEMHDLDAVMRGVGRMRDSGLAPAWGPGRHGPGANVFAYFVAPFGAVVEFSTAVETVAEDYRTGAPEDWTWPPNRIDHWGLSTKDTQALAAAERTFRFSGAEAGANVQQDGAKEPA